MNKNILNIMIIFAIAFSLLFLRLMHLQLVQNDKFSSLAADNAAKTFAQPAPRGVIYDRFGKVMVENRPVFSVQVLPYILSGMDKNEQNRILNKLSELLGETVKFKVSPNEPIFVKDNISLQTAVRIKERERELDGVLVSSRPVRLYPYASLAAHLLGHVGEIKSTELKSMQNEGYRMGDVIGKEGVEKIYDKLIRGKDGGKKIEVDVYGNPTRFLESLDPIPGADMWLTIDLEMQQVAENFIGKQEGAAVVMDAKTGEILALASHPNFDPNLFAVSLDNWMWKKMEKEKHPFMNRALAIYPPGSIFKVITLSAALEENQTNYDEMITCTGSFKEKNRIAKCWLEGGHGRISVKEGLVWSCDVVYYILAKRIGVDLITKYAKKYGLGSYTGLDLPQEKKGFLPTAAWKANTLHEMWYDGDSINYGIGQGFVQVTPIQMANVYSTIGTGKMKKPYIVKEIRDSEGKTLYKGKTEILGDVPISEKNLKIVRAALREVVERGTGVATRLNGIPAAGKTGTAENPGLAHAWFMCYAPYDDPEIVIGVFIAHGEHGDRASAYVARDILNWYKNNRLTKKYPDEPPFRQYILHGNIAVPYGRRRAADAQTIKPTVEPSSDKILNKPPEDMQDLINTPQ